MDAETHDLIRRIHASPAQAVVVVAGGGAQSMSWLLKVPSASRTVLEMLVPYSDQALADFLGEKPRRIASVETAEVMSRRAYCRAVELADEDVPVVGIGCTAAIATDRVKRGAHRVHVARCTSDSVVTYSLEFTKGLRDRVGEDTIASLAGRAGACGSRRRAHGSCHTVVCHRALNHRRLRRPHRPPRCGRDRHRPCPR